MGLSQKDLDNILEVLEIEFYYNIISVSQQDYTGIIIT
jgi:hypothetical protein